MMALAVSEDEKESPWSVEHPPVEELPIRLLFVLPAHRRTEAPPRDSTRVLHRELPGV